jgi:predicted Zn-dependent protease
VVAAARELPALPSGLALIVAEALVRTGDSKAGFDLLESVAKDYPDNPDVQLTRARLRAYRPGS